MSLPPKGAATYGVGGLVSGNLGMPVKEREEPHLIESGTGTEKQERGKDSVITCSLVYFFGWIGLVRLRAPPCACCPLSDMHPFIMSLPTLMIVSPYPLSSG
jgi:hypothetical protein